MPGCIRQYFKNYLGNNYGSVLYGWHQCLPKQNCNFCPDGVLGRIFFLYTGKGLPHKQRGRPFLHNRHSSNPYFFCTCKMNLNFLTFLRRTDIPHISFSVPYVLPYSCPYFHYTLSGIPHNRSGQYLFV